MKLLAEKTEKIATIENNPEFIDQIKIVLTTVLFKAIENKIDWDAKNLDIKNIQYSASVNIMNNAEWKMAKEILENIIKKFPQAESDIKQVFSIIDPMRNFK